MSNVAISSTCEQLTLVLLLRSCTICICQRSVYPKPDDNLCDCEKEVLLNQHCDWEDREYFSGALIYTIIGYTFYEYTIDEYTTIEHSN